MTGEMFHEQVEVPLRGWWSTVSFFKQLGEAHSLEACLFSTGLQIYDQVQVTSDGAVLETEFPQAFMN